MIDTAGLSLRQTSRIALVVALAMVPLILLPGLHSLAHGQATLSCSPRSDPVPDTLDRPPVVLVHGWNSGLDGMTKHRDGLVDRLGKDYAPFRFDYSQANNSWPSEPAIGACLARYIGLVSAARVAGGGEPGVAVVGHSMGGIAARFAAQAYADDASQTRAGDLMTTVVTLSTPHTGSPFGGRLWADLPEITAKGINYGDFLPPEESAAADCLAPLSRRDQFCPPSPPLPAHVALLQLGTQVVVERSLVRLDLPVVNPIALGTNDIYIAGDGIVPLDSAHGYFESVPVADLRPVVAVDGTVTPRTLSVRTVECRYETDYLKGLQLGGRLGGQLGGSLGAALGALAGYVGNIALDSAALNDLLDGDNEVSAAMLELILIAQFSDCGHSSMTHHPQVLDLTAEAIRAAPLSPKIVVTTASAADRGLPEPDPFGRNAPVVVVMDTSGSMNDTDPNGVVKIDGARSAVVETLNRLPTDALFALHVYPGSGPRERDGCPAGTTQIGLGRLDPVAASAAVRRLAADGETPTGPAMLTAAEMLALRGVGDATMVLVSDGLSNCGPPPCEVAETLTDRGITVVNTVGFELDAAGESELSCIARVTGGRYFTADDTEELAAAVAEASNTAMQVRVDPLSQVPVTVGADAPTTLRATVVNPGTKTAADVQVRLTFTDVPGPLVLRPVRRVGNIPPGEERSAEFAFTTSPDLAGGTVAWQVLASSPNAPSGQAEGRTRVVDILDRTTLGPLLSNVERVAVLGDSYASGEGTGKYTEDSDTDDNRCHRSPSTHAATLWGEDTINLACSGAVIGNLFHRNPNNDEPPQLQLLRQAAISDKPPGAVILSLGGNDLGFSTIVTNCLVFSDDCHDSAFRAITNWPSTGRTSRYGTYLGERADSLTTPLVEAYSAIDRTINDAAALDARDGSVAPIVVMPYPRITPRDLAGDDGSLAEYCTTYLSTEEVTFLNTLVDRLNAAITVAANLMRTQGRPIYVASTVEDAFQPAATMCEGTGGAVTVPNSTSLSGVAASKVTTDTSGWFHPNESGYQAIARALVQWSKNQPPLPGDIGPAEGWDVNMIAPPTFYASRVPLPSVDPMGQSMMFAHGSTTITVDRLEPGTTVHAWLDSQPRAVGSAPVDDTGMAELTLSVPTSVSPGPHTLSVIGTGRDRQPVLGSTQLTVIDARLVAAGLWAALAAGLAMGACWLSLRRRPAAHRCNQTGDRDDSGQAPCPPTQGPRRTEATG